MVNETEHAQRESAVSRLSGMALVGIVAAVLALSASLIFAVPPAAGLAGVVVMVLTAAWAQSEPTKLKSPAGDSLVLRPTWPETPMKLIIEALPEPCLLTDSHGMLRYQNQAAVGRFGVIRPGEPLSLKLRGPELLGAVERAGRGETVFGIPYIERVPTERSFSAGAIPIRMAGRDGKGRVDFVLLTFRDDTELLRTEKMRADFIANASHELRTPLASLTGFIETLLGPARNDTVNRERFLAIMLEQAQRMARLIDDLMSLSRIEMRAHVRPDDPIDLAELVGHVIDMMAPLAMESGTRIIRPVEPGPFPIRGDRDELIQVASNLVENAIKYGKEGGQVTVTLARETGMDGLSGCLLGVQDDGPGIPEEHIPRLTERFYRVDPDGSRRRKGTGLGLAIVKHIVQRHKGRLIIRSRSGEGSYFGVWLQTNSGAS